MVTEIYAHEVHDPEAEMQGFLAECEEAYRRDHEMPPAQDIHAEVDVTPGPGPMFTLRAKVRPA